MDYVAHLIAKRILRTSMVYMPRPLAHYWLAALLEYLEALIQGAFLLGCAAHPIINLLGGAE